VGRHRWNAPLVGAARVNWDVAVAKTKQRMGVGVIIRDRQGCVLATMISLRPYITDPIVAKTVATLAVVVFAKDLGLQKIQMKGEALQVVKALQNGGRNSHGHGSSLLVFQLSFLHALL
jgi:hypothetical protein